MEREERHKLYISSNAHRFQCWTFLNHTRLVQWEAKITNLQLLHLWTLLQHEGPSSSLSEAVIFNNDTLQVLHSYHLQTLRKLERIMTNYQCRKLRISREVNIECPVVTATFLYNNRGKGLC